jgi:RHS repeat-associated protein
MLFYVHTDHLNAPRKIAQPSSGTLAWRWDADPFGTAAPNDNPAGLGAFAYNLRFPGQYYQSETGLNQNWNRDYDPQVGRYVESDPIGQRIYFDFARFTGQNVGSRYWNHLYNYVDDNPVMGRDSRGLLPDWLEWFSEFFKDKAPAESLSKTVGTGLSAICIARNCGKTRGSTELQGDCISYLNDWAKGHPELLGTLGGITSDGAAAAVSDCAELCAKGIKAGACGCPKGTQ